MTTLWRTTNLNLNLLRNCDHFQAAKRTKDQTELYSTFKSYDQLPHHATTPQKIQSGWSFTFVNCLSSFPSPAAFTDTGNSVFKKMLMLKGQSVFLWIQAIQIWKAYSFESTPAISCYSGLWAVSALISDVPFSEFCTAQQPKASQFQVSSTSPTAQW